MGEVTVTTRDDGSRFRTDDPGEVSSGLARISVNYEEGELLAFIATGRTVLEIGTGLGVSTGYLASTAKHLVTLDIDPWVHENVWPTLPSWVITLSSRERLLREFDMVFIDGDHRPEAVREDMRFAVEVCPRGVIVVHDYIETQESLRGWSWQVIPTRVAVGICHVGWGL